MRYCTLLLPFFLFVSTTRLTASVYFPTQDSIWKPRVGEVGINISNTLGSFLGNTQQNPNSDPYILSLRFGSLTKRVRIGAAWNVKNNEDFDFNLSRNTKETTIKARVGYEWVSMVNRKIGFYYGADVVADLTQERVNSINVIGGSPIRAGLSNRVVGVGGGPILGIVYRPHPRVSLMTEGSAYAVFRSGFKEINAPPDVRKTNVKELRIQTIVPTALFINFAF